MGEGIDPVDDKQLEEFEKLVKDNFVDTLDDQLTTGTVINITDRDAIIDINAKSEGVISLNEFRYNPDLKVGDTVDVIVIEAFLPGSQIDVKPIRDYDAYVGKTMEFKVVKINHEFKNVVVSHKALIEADIEEQKK